MTGEAGIGKTALVTEAVRNGATGEATVVWGMCWDGEGKPDYWPWVQVLRALQRTASSQEWADVADAAGGELAALLGEASVQQPPVPFGEQSFALSDALTTTLVTLARRRPLVIILEDLHWCDAASLRLLDFVVRHTWFEKVLLIGTYRDTEVDTTDHPVQPLLLPLASNATTVVLTGLDRDAVQVLLERSAETRPTGDLVAEVHQRTGGNPFFVEQAAHLLRTRNSVHTAAPTVRDAIERRLGLLPEAVQDLLTTAAVLGREQHHDLLATISGHTPRELEDLLAEAVTTRLLVPLGDGWWRFVHDLVREALYDRLDEAGARRCHAAVVDALDLHPQLGRSNPSSAALHAYLAVPEIAPDRAVALLRQASASARSRWALDEATEHLRRALEVPSSPSPREHATLATDLAISQWLQGDTATSLQTAQTAAAALRTTDDPDARAIAALTFRSLAWNLHRGEHARLATDLVNEAHARLVGAGRDESADDTGDIHREQELCSWVIARARERQDDGLLLTGLVARFCALWGVPRAVTERESIADELVALSDRGADPIGLAEVAGRLYRFVTQLALGHPDWRNAVASMSVMFNEAPNLTYPVSADRMLLAVEAATQGRFDDADWLLDTADPSAHQSDLVPTEPIERRIIRLHQRWTLALLRGHLDGTTEAVDRARAAGHPEPDLLAALTTIERGDTALAERYLARLAATDEPLSRWFAAFRLLLEVRVAAVSGDQERCDEARRDLAPYLGQWVVVYPDVPYGPWILWAGTLDMAQERWDEAVARFTAADAAARRLGAPPWSVEARVRLAEALLSRNAPADADAARDLLDDLDREATELGMGHAVERAQRLRHRQDLPAQPPPPTKSNGEEPPPADAGEATETGAVFRFDGQVWVLSYLGRTVHLPDAKGLRDLQVLLGNPGNGISAVDLVNPEGDTAVQASRRLGGDPVLDAQARSDYRERLAQLDDQIERALQRHDDQRAAELDRERLALITELRRAVGLGGRPRTLGNEAERARKTVTARLRATLRRIEDHHPELGEHLRAAISTGSTCRYQPRTAIAWSL